MTQKRRVNEGIVVAFCVVLSGCAVQMIQSNHTEACGSGVENALCSHKVPVGFAYSLPKGQVLFAAFRKPITAADAAKAQADVATAYTALADATGKLQSAQTSQQKNTKPGETDAQKSQDQAAVAGAKATLAAAQATVDSANQKLTDLKNGLPASAADIATATQDAAALEVKLKVAKVKLAAAQKTGKQADIETKTSELNKAQSNFDAATAYVTEVKGRNQKFVETFTLTPQAIVPDETQRFVANLNHSGNRDDTMKLSVVNGMLTTTNTQSTDQTASIIESLASAAFGIVTFVGAGIPLVPPTPAPAAPAGPPQPKPDSCEYVYARMFDPANADEVKAINDELGKNPIQANIELSSTFATSNPTPKLHQLTPYAGNAKAIDGVVYRTAAGVTVQVTPTRTAMTSPCALQSLPQASSMQVIVPDSNAEFIAPMEAGRMTASGFQYSFSNGMLTDYNLTRPSEVAAIASIPVDIVNKIMTIPTSILKFRLDYSTAQTNLASQQAALVTAQGGEAIALVNAKSALEAAETNLTTADLNEPTARFKALTALVQAKQALADAIAAAAKATAAAAQPVAGGITH